MISTLLFDLGDVFVNLNKAAIAERFEQSGLQPLPMSLQQAHEAYETGRISDSDLFHAYQAFVPGLKQQSFLEHWNTLLGKLPLYRLHFLQQLKPRYRLLLLSNTNALHIAHLENTLPHYTRFKNCFDGFYLSYEMGLRKPNTKAFQYVFEEQNTKPNEVLFIDDTAKNIATAKALGCQTWLLNPKTQDVIELFNHANL